MTRVVNSAVLHGAIRDSIAELVRAIGASMGPEGRATLYGSGRAVRPALTGVEIARHGATEGGVAGLAQGLLRETLVEADRELGDGTARLAVMTDAVLAEGTKAIAAGIESGFLLARIAALGPEIEAAFAAETAAEYDPAALARSCGVGDGLAALLAEALAAAGREGQVELVAGHEAGSTLRPAAGFVFEAPAIEASPIAAMRDVSLIVADDIITDFRSLAPVIEGFAQQRKPLLVAARGVEGQALALLEANRRAGLLTVTAMTPRDAGPRAAMLLEDLAIATGAALVAERTGLSLAALRPAQLGRAAEFRRKGERVFLEGTGGDPAAIALRRREIEGVIRASRHLAFDREHALRRRARLGGAWVEVELGHADPLEAERQLVLARRALASLQLAPDGVLAGGGAGLDAIALRLAAPSAADAAGCAARALVVAALRAPGRHIRRNAGCTDGTARPVTATGAVDPVRLSRVLLDQALSLATRLLGLERAVLRG